MKANSVETRQRLSVPEMAAYLNQKLVPAKRNGIWQANTVRGILAYAGVERRKLEAGQKTDLDEVGSTYRAIEERRRYRPEVDSYISPCLTVELPPEADSRLPSSSFMH